MLSRSNTAILYIVGALLILGTSWGLHRLWDGFISHTSKAQDEKEFRFRKGVMDLTHWDSRRTVSWEGEWEFYWNTFLAPEDFSGSHSGQNSLLEKNKKPDAWIWALAGVPWTSNHFADGTHLPDHGFGTYRFRLTHVPDESLAIYLNTVSTAYRLFVNGVEVYSVGQVGKDVQSSIPFFLPRVIELPRAESLEFVIHVSNFHHVGGGIWRKIQMGELESVRKLRDVHLFMDIFAFGSFFIMAFYHFGLYLIRRQDVSALYFGMFLVIMAVRALVTGEHFLYQILGLENFSLDWGMRLEYFGFYLGIPFSLFYLHSLFPAQKIRWIAYPISIVMGFLGLLTIFLEAPVFTKFTFYVEYVIVISLLYGVFVVGKACKDRVPNSILMAIGVGVFFVTVINDIAFSRHLVDTGYYTHWGFYIFVFNQSIIISRRYAQAYRKVEALSGNLERLVDVRTQEYRDQKEKAESANLWKNQLISLVAHDLRSPLASLYGALDLLGEEDIEAQERQAIIRSSKESIQRSLSSIAHLLTLDRFQTGGFSLNRESVNLHALVQGAVAFLEKEVLLKNLTLEVNLPGDEIVFVDEHLFREVIRNILLNAVKFSHPDSRILVFFEKKSEGRILSIQDFGIGMTPQVREKVLRGERQNSSRGTKGESGFGMGMSICLDILRIHDARLEIISAPDQGTTVGIWMR